MHFVIEPHQQAAHPHLMEQMFRLRQRVFCQELDWVETNGPEERDVYDDYNPVYVLHTDATGQHLYGSARLMPMSGPTLLSDVFGDTLPDAAGFDAPFVWEITRLCIDDRLMREHGRGHERIRTLRLMRAASLEFGVRAGVETYLANFDDLRLRMWRRCGAHFDVIGTSQLFSTTVHLGISECSPEELARALGALGTTGPILSPLPRSERGMVGVRELMAA